MKKKKPYWEMNTQELAAATKQFDDPNDDPPAVKSTAAERAKLRRWQRKRAAARTCLTLSLDKKLIEQADDYAAHHGITISEMVADALKRWMSRKSA